MQTRRVFLSHTSDLATFPQRRSFVQGALDAVARAGMLAIDMRYFAVREGQPAAYCQQRVRECDVYVAIVGFRYGSIVPGSDVSYTELEFDEATAAHLPRLVFLFDDTGDETDDAPAIAADPDRTAVERFRQRVQEAGLICGWFTTVDGLELGVFHALRELAGADTRPVPRQIPAAVAHFAGRSEELAALASLADGHAEAGGTVVISAIGGTAGVGKTTLAVHWAHRIAQLFPDGQLYVNLRGFHPDGVMMEPAEALRRFLDALGVPAGRIPVGVDARADLYRSELSGRRVLVLLDNARDTAQVRPLLPGTPTCMVLVTSRNRLTGLVAADGARAIALDLLTPAEARDLLAGRLGERRVAAESGAVEEIVAACARLPLALAIVAAHAATDPRLPLRVLAEELRDAGRRLDVLTTDDPGIDVRAVFSWSYRALSPAAARLFRLLGLHPGADVSTAAAASLAGLPVSRIRPLLAELTGVRLLDEPVPDRYALHDLLRAYAAERARVTDSDAQRRSAIRRMLDHYLQHGYAADRLLDPARQPIAVAPAHGIVVEPFADAKRAMAWFVAEHSVLLAAVDLAAAARFDTHAWQLTWTLVTFLDRRGGWEELVEAQRCALAAAQRLSDPAAQVIARCGLAGAYTRLGRLDDARTQLGYALEVGARSGDLTGQANTHHNLAQLWEREERYDRALEHSRRSLELYRAAGHRQGQAQSLNAVGWFLALLGDYRQALVNCEQALVLHQELDDRIGQCDTWDSLGYAHLHLGHHAQAITCYRHAIELLRDLGHRYAESDTLTHLGDAYHAAGDPDAARTAWRQALGILDRLHHPGAAHLRARLASIGERTDDGQA